MERPGFLGLAHRQILSVLTETFISEEAILAYTRKQAEHGALLRTCRVRTEQPGIVVQEFLRTRWVLTATGISERLTQPYTQEQVVVGL